MTSDHVWTALQVLDWLRSEIGAGFYLPELQSLPMNVRDAVEADAPQMAAIADAPTDVMRTIIHDRTVRVADDGGDALEDAPGSNSTAADADGASQTDDAGLLGFVSFDARQRSVHVTQLDGTAAACERLLAEPIRFADCEDMCVELLVPDHDDAVATAAEQVGFDRDGDGPRFEGERTTRYRLDP